MKKPIFTGAGVAIVTPFIDDETVNYEEFGKIIDHQIEHGRPVIGADASFIVISTHHFFRQEKGIITALIEHQTRIFL